MHCRTYSFVNDTTLPSDDPLRFKKNPLKQYIAKLLLLIIRLEIKNYNMILIEIIKITYYFQGKGLMK